MIWSPFCALCAFSRQSVPRLSVFLWVLCDLCGYRIRLLLSAPARSGFPFACTRVCSLALAPVTCFCNLGVNLSRKTRFQQILTALRSASRQFSFRVSRLRAFSSNHARMKSKMSMSSLINVCRKNRKEAQSQDSCSGGRLARLMAVRKHRPAPRKNHTSKNPGPLRVCPVKPRTNCNLSNGLISHHFNWFQTLSTIIF